MHFLLGNADTTLNLGGRRRETARATVSRFSGPLVAVSARPNIAPVPLFRDRPGTVGGRASWFRSLCFSRSIGINSPEVTAGELLEAVAAS